MAISPSARLQNLVLSIASRNGAGLDLSKSNGEKAMFQPLPETAVRAGERVLLLGAGDGKNTYIAARAAGPSGQVLAFETDADLRETAVEQSAAFENQFGFRNWTLEAGELDDLRTNPQFLADALTENPVGSLDSYQALQDKLETQRRDNPRIDHDSVDVVILDLVINRLPAAKVDAALTEAFRVLKRGGRLIVLGLLADESAPLALPKLPNGLTALNAPVEKEIDRQLDQAGFYGMTYAWRAELPLAVAQGVELRAFRLEAYKGKQGACYDHGHAVLFKGPWSEAYDDDGHRFVRGERTAVCKKTYEILTREPYAQYFEGIPSYVSVPEDQAPLFDCNTPQLRDPQVTKGNKSVFEQTSASSASDCCGPSTEASSCCAPGGGCC